MKILDRYVMVHIFGLTAIVALGLTAIHAFLTFVAEMDETGRGDFGYLALLRYTLWLTPTGLYLMLPIIAMLGTLMGLGTLASQAELTAMRASGLSLMRLGGATLGAGVVLGGICFGLGDWLAPNGQARAEALKSEAQSGSPAGVGGRAVWLREGQHIVHIQRLIAEDHIADVEIFTLGEGLRLASAARVAEGRYVDGGWRMQEVRRTIFGESSAAVESLASERWPGGVSPDVLRLFVLEADALSVGGLLRLIEYLDANELDTGEYALSLARKLTAPFTVAAMMLFAIPFVLGPLRNTGAGQRLFVGILIGLLFYMVNEVTANTGRLYGWHPLLSASAPTVAFALFALWRLRTAR